MTRFLLAVLLVLACLPAEAGKRLRFHFPDTGVPPYLVVNPGQKAPTGIVVEILEAAALKAGRTVVYDMQPRRHAAASLTLGAADGAMFFSKTRPAPRGVALTRPVVDVDAVLVTRAVAPILYTSNPAQLHNRKLCTLTDEKYPPLEAAFSQHKVFRAEAKTEQAQLMILRTEGCHAAIVNAPVYRWLAGRYDYDSDLIVEPRPLFTEQVQLGFAGTETEFAEMVNNTLDDYRRNGLLAKIIRRHVPQEALLSIR